MLFPLDILTQHPSWWTTEHLKMLFESAAYAAAFLFFVYKVAMGNFTSQMALTISCKRAHRSPAEDDLAVVAKVKKGKTGTVKLHDVQARIISLATPPQTWTLELIGAERLSYNRDTTKWPKWQGEIRRKIVWTVSDKNPFLNLAPGDQAQFACTRLVPRDVPATVEVVVLGHRWWSRYRSQWRSSIISLPVTPP